MMRDPRGSYLSSPRADAAIYIVARRESVRAPPSHLKSSGGQVVDEDGAIFCRFPACSLRARRNYRADMVSPRPSP